MTMAGYDTLYLLTMATITLSALMFSVLALFYWRERRTRPPSVFAAFTVVCAAAFALNLLLRLVPRAQTPLTVALDLATGMVPPLLLHLVLQAGRRFVLAGFYAIAVAAAVAAGLDDLDLVTASSRDLLPALLLGGAGILGLLLGKAEIRPLRAWYRVLLGLTVVAAASLRFSKDPC
ncbi:MAG: hypothetical protein LAP40_02255 [Acidobacteriia bacterium]|nr:hypothetical protein [Terriglobia bacterium]